MVRQSTDLLSYWLLLLIASVYIIQTEAQYIGIYPWGSHVSAEDRMQEILEELHAAPYLEAYNDLHPSLLSFHDTETEMKVGNIGATAAATAAGSGGTGNRKSKFLRDEQKNGYNIKVQSVDEILAEHDQLEQRGHELRRQQTDQVDVDSVEIPSGGETGRGRRSPMAKLHKADSEMAEVAKAKADEDAARASPYPPELVDPDALSATLAHLCLVHPAQWWNYEWCHRKSVSQFHIAGHEDVGYQSVAVGSNPAWKRDPDYSLGTYTRSLVVREGGDSGNTSARILKIVDMYTGGQKLDELQNGYRSTEVHIQCCPNPYPNPNAQVSKGSPFEGLGLGGDGTGDEEEKEEEEESGRDSDGDRLRWQARGASQRGFLQRRLRQYGVEFVSGSAREGDRWALFHSHKSQTPGGDNWAGGDDGVGLISESLDLDLYDNLYSRGMLTEEDLLEYNADEEALSGNVWLSEDPETGTVHSTGVGSHSGSEYDRANNRNNDNYPEEYYNDLEFEIELEIDVDGSYVVDALESIAAGAGGGGADEGVDEVGVNDVGGTNTQDRGRLKRKGATRQVLVESGRKPVDTTSGKAGTGGSSGILVDVMDVEESAGEEGPGVDNPDGEAGDRVEHRRHEVSSRRGRGASVISTSTTTTITTRRTPAAVVLSDGPVGQGGKSEKDKGGRGSVAAAQLAATKARTLPAKGVSIKYVKEPSVGQYEVGVCHPMLCVTDSTGSRTKAGGHRSLYNPRHDAVEKARDRHNKEKGLSQSPKTNLKGPSKRQSSAINLDASTNEKVSKGLVALMSTLNSVKPCYFYPPSVGESWWVYEVCFNGRGIMQTHFDKIITADASSGVQHEKMEPVVQYSLGFPDLLDFQTEESLMNRTIKRGTATSTRNAEILANSPTLRDLPNIPQTTGAGVPQSTVNAATGGAGATMFNQVSQPSLRFEFKGGSLCELDLSSSNDASTGTSMNTNNRHADSSTSTTSSQETTTTTATASSMTPNNADIETTPRASTVDIYCGDSDSIVSIEEDHTCHYNVKISSTLLCLHDSFKPASRQVVRFSLEKV